VVVLAKYLSGWKERPDGKIELALDDGTGKMVASVWGDHFRPFREGLHATDDTQTNLNYVRITGTLSKFRSEPEIDIRTIVPVTDWHEIPEHIFSVIMAVQYAKTGDEVE
jgi:DNA/RNA endonuclease YhcR with UshA esterase domain